MAIPVTKPHRLVATMVGATSRKPVLKLRKARARRLAAI